MKNYLIRRTKLKAKEQIPRAIKKKINGRQLIKRIKLDNMPRSSHDITCIAVRICKRAPGGLAPGETDPITPTRPIRCPAALQRGMNNDPGTSIMTSIFSIACRFDSSCFAFLHHRFSALRLTLFVDDARTVRETCQCGGSAASPTDRDLIGADRDGGVR